MKAPVAGLVLVLVVPLPLGAACTCTVSASASAPDLQFSGRSAGACARLTRLVMGIDGGSGLGTVECYGTSCSLSKTSTIACLRTGAHTVNSWCWCGKLTSNGFCDSDSGSASTTFMVNTTPTVGVSYSGPDLDGHGTLSIPFSFPNTIWDGHRQLTAYADGHQLFQYYMLNVSGTYTTSLSTACWAQGSHELAARVISCTERGDPDYDKLATTTVQVDHTPQVVTATPKFPPCWTLIFPPSARRTDGDGVEIGEARRGA